MSNNVNGGIQEFAKDHHENKTRKKDPLTSSTTSTTSRSTNYNAFFIDPTRATTSMAESLEELRSGLLCPICNHLMKDPTTLSCTHSFCMECISNQKAWTCVMPGCNMPVTLRGKKSYIVNPQLSSVVSSLEVIQKTINSARPEWWKCSSYSQTMMSQHFGAGSPHFLSNGSPGVAREENSSDEEENDKVVSFNMEMNTERYNDDDDDDDDSDATTLGDEKDADSFLTPILKRRKRNDNHRPTQTIGHHMDNDRTKNGCQLNSEGKDPALDSDISASIINVAPTVSISAPTSNKNNINDNDNDNNTTNVNRDKDHLETSHKSKNMVNDINLDNHTPNHNLNKSCSLPDVSFHASPIARESSQVESQSSQLLCPSPFMKKPMMDILKEGEVDGTTEECDNDHNNVESIRHENTTMIDNIQKDMQKESSETNSKSNTQEIITDIGNATHAPQQSVQPKPPIPKVFLLSPSSSLTLADQRILKKLIKKERLIMLHPQSSHDLDNDLDFCFDFDSNQHHIDCFLQSLYTKDDTSHYPVEYSYAICSNAEYQMFEGYIMPRNFRYILAVACGLSIIDFSYLRQAANQSSFGESHHSQKYLYAPGTMKECEGGEMTSTSGSSRRKRSRGKDGDEREVNYQIAGDVDSLEIMGPQRSREVMIQRLGHLDRDDIRYNNGLLDGYHVILFGDYDDPTTLKTFMADQKEENGRGRKGRKQTSKTNSAAVATDNQYTKGRVRMLLQLCGAKVCDEATSNVQISTDSKVIILTKYGGAKDKEGIKIILDAGYSPKELIERAPIVGLKWLQDTIAEFKIKNIDDYVHK